MQFSAKIFPNDRFLPQTEGLPPPVLEILDAPLTFFLKRNYDLWVSKETFLEEDNIIDLTGKRNWLSEQATFWISVHLHLLNEYAIFRFMFYIVLGVICCRERSLTEMADTQLWRQTLFSERIGHKMSFGNLLVELRSMTFKRWPTPTPCFNSSVWYFTDVFRTIHGFRFWMTSIVILGVGNRNRPM